MVLAQHIWTKVPSFTECLLYEVCLTKVEDRKSSLFSSEEIGIRPTCLHQPLCRVKLWLGSQQLKEGRAGGPAGLASIVTKMNGFEGGSGCTDEFLDGDWLHSHQYLSFWHQCTESVQRWESPWQLRGGFFRPFLLEAWLQVWFLPLQFCSLQSSLLINSFSV